VQTEQSRASADGTVTARDGRHILRYERWLAHPAERVWAALTQPEQIAAWLADADIDLREGGTVELRWLNTNNEGGKTVARGTVTRCEPPRWLEFDTDVHGRLRWQLTPLADGCRLLFTADVAFPVAMLTLVLAGWHTHLDFLAEALDGARVDWPNWPRDRWTAHHERYSVRLRAEDATTTLP
jgi:uncharacterized protein YndB with AHSA1/START domain